MLIAGIPVEFFIFALMLLGVALSHGYAMQIAVGGMALTALYKIVAAPFPEGAGLSGFVHHFNHEWVMLANLLLLLMGFALLARSFEKSRIPDLLPRFLPDDWKGGFFLLVLIFVLSSFLDNIAAAIIGGTIAATVYKGRVHLGYLAAIVAASNAGGSGSVVGDTTTTMLWISGISPERVVEAYIAAGVALCITGYFASRQQHALQPIQRDALPDTHIDWAQLGIVALMLAAAIGVNLLVNTRYPDVSDQFPFIGVAVWVAIAIGVIVRRPAWQVLPDALRGAVFLLALVFAASMMPVESLPAPSWQTTLGLGFVSAVFDNIPLTALAIKQSGYDWGFVAYAVGYGGSMLWFGSSAGVALTGLFPEGRSVGQWLREGWHVAVGYVVGFFVMLVLIGFHPDQPARTARQLPVQSGPLEAPQR